MNHHHDCDDYAHQGSVSQLSFSPGHSSSLPPALVTLSQGHGLCLPPGFAVVFFVLVVVCYSLTSWPLPASRFVLSFCCCCCCWLFHDVLTWPLLALSFFYFSFLLLLFVCCCLLFHEFVIWPLPASRPLFQFDLFILILILITNTNRNTYSNAGTVVLTQSSLASFSASAVGLNITLNHCHHHCYHQHWHHQCHHQCYLKSNCSQHS